MLPDLYWLLPSFFAVAMVYSMAGFAGGSSYLALLALSRLDHGSLPPLALACNIIVSAGGVYHFWRRGYLKRNHVVPFLTAVPAAYFGAKVVLSPKIFFLLLAASLLVAGLRLLLSENVWMFRRSGHVPPVRLWGPLLGLVLGFWSGMVGIGGGIFLSPLLLLFGWADAKHAAGAASVFILINSVAGLAGRIPHAMPEASMLLPLGIAVLLGGQIGSRLGSFQLPRLAVQRVTAVLILMVGVKLLQKLF